jgi:hypothetical protein
MPIAVVDEVMQNVRDVRLFLSRCAAGNTIDYAAITNPASSARQCEEKICRTSRRDDFVDHNHHPHNQ